MMIDTYRQSSGITRCMSDEESYKLAVANAKAVIKQWLDIIPENWVD